MNKFAAILLITISMFAAAALWGGQQANAASIYDDVYQTTDEMRISSYNNAVSIEDAEFKYQEMIDGIYDDHTVRYVDGSSGGSQPAGGTKQQNIADQWNNRERWSISQSCDVDEPLNGCSIMLYFTVDDSLALQWNTNTVNVANPSTVRQIKISWYESIPGIYVDYRPTTSGSESGSGYFGGAISGLTHSTRVRNYVTYADFLDYPTGYEGELVRDTVSPAIVLDPKEYYPRVSYTYYGGTLLRGKDAAIDLCIPFDPDYIDNDVMLADGAYYMDCADWSLFNIEYKLIDDDTDDVVDTQVLTRIDETYEFNELQQPNKYRLEVRYLYTDCGAECLPHSFNRPLYEGATLATSVMIIDTSKGPFSGLSEDEINCTTENGVRTCDVNDGPECFSITAPYIDLPACLSDINVVVHNLSFGAISFVKVPPATECKTLGTIGEWLHLENKTVCPQVPKTMRDIITPFITFALGMMIIIMISKIARGSDT